MSGATEWNWLDRCIHELGTIADASGAITIAFICRKHHSIHMPTLATASDAAQVVVGVAHHAVQAFGKELYDKAIQGALQELDLKVGPPDPSLLDT